MTFWHTVLYTAAAILALRSFVQLMTNYRADYEKTAVASQLERMREQVEAQAAKEAAAQGAGEVIGGRVPETAGV